jgi:predicted RNase H-like HicB family nuclease
LKFDTHPTCFAGTPLFRGEFSQAEACDYKALDFVGALIYSMHRNEKICRRIWMKFIVTVEKDEDGMFVIECPAIPGCVSQGKTEDEALENITDAIKQCLEVRAEKGMPLTVSTKEVEVTV